MSSFDINLDLQALQKEEKTTVVKQIWHLEKFQLSRLIW